MLEDENLDSRKRPLLDASPDSFSSKIVKRDPSRHVSLSSEAGFANLTNTSQLELFLNMDSSNDRESPENTNSQSDAGPSPRILSPVLEVSREGDLSGRNVTFRSPGRKTPARKSMGISGELRKAYRGYSPIAEARELCEQAAGAGTLNSTVVGCIKDRLDDISFLHHEMALNQEEGLKTKLEKADILITQLTDELEDLKEEKNAMALELIDVKRQLDAQCKNEDKLKEEKERLAMEVQELKQQLKEMGQTIDLREELKDLAKAVHSNGQGALSNLQDINEKLSALDQIAEIKSMMTKARDDEIESLRSQNQKLNSELIELSKLKAREGALNEIKDLLKEPKEPVDGANEGTAAALGIMKAGTEKMDDLHKMVKDLQEQFLSSMVTATSATDGDRDMEIRMDESKALQEELEKTRREIVSLKCQYGVMTKRVARKELGDGAFEPPACLFSATQLKQIKQWMTSVGNDEEERPRASRTPATRRKTTAAAVEQGIPDVESVLIIEPETPSTSRRTSNRRKTREYVLGEVLQNPVVLLDDVDEEEEKETILEALRKVLDPKQNSAFVDASIGVPFDLSEVFFIVTTHESSTKKKKRIADEKAKPSSKPAKPASGSSETPSENFAGRRLFVCETLGVRSYPVESVKEWRTNWQYGISFVAIVDGFTRFIGAIETCKNFRSRVTLVTGDVKEATKRAVNDCHHLLKQNLDKYGIVNQETMKDGIHIHFPNLRLSSLSWRSSPR
ncbi:hypothetical protein QR680_018913 [Steinernema hermaphroditum]|uniref:Uncharacterized protein n=1 Tax=Steinernema hermaphroditum TaxID=289476 RepID=A0AA39HJE7_9BILA|nr:hypothetical protein QR680_018913 [Steinernema hermaphroditum]